ncbi:MAG: hypothetical protein EU541_04865, partial [Promethearchaeota archaeon]
MRETINPLTKKREIIMKKIFPIVIGAIIVIVILGGILGVIIILPKGGSSKDSTEPVITINSPTNSTYTSKSLSVNITTSDSSPIDTIW